METESTVTSTSASTSNEKTNIWRFDPVDITQMQLLAALPPSGRIRLMLNVQTLIRGTIRGRLRRLYPDASNYEIGLKLLEELSRDRQVPSF